MEARLQNNWAVLRVREAAGCSLISLSSTVFLTNSIFSESRM